MNDSTIVQTDHTITGLETLFLVTHLLESVPADDPDAGRCQRLLTAMPLVLPPESKEAGVGDGWATMRGAMAIMGSIPEEDDYHELAQALMRSIELVSPERCHPLDGFPTGTVDDPNYGV